MTYIILILPLVILALVAAAIHEHSLALSLPLSPIVTFVTIILPLLAGVNLLSLPCLTSKAPRKSRSVFGKSMPVMLQYLQGIITTVLATLYFSDFWPKSSMVCEMSTQWQHLFSTKNQQAIRAIQEALQCCGFRTVMDMAWPFPPTDVQCSETFDRTLACQSPWTSAFQRDAGVNFALVLAVGAMQIFVAFYARHYGEWMFKLSWGSRFQQWLHRYGAGRAASRPLLARQEAQVEETDEETGENGSENDPRYGSMYTNQGLGPRNNIADWNA